MAEPDTPQEEQEQQRYREETMIAGDPVSRGASNKDLPTYKDKIATNKEQEQTDQSPVYDKLLHIEASGPVADTDMLTTGAWVLLAVACCPLRRLPIAHVTALIPATAR